MKTKSEPQNATVDIINNDKIQNIKMLHRWINTLLNVVAPQRALNGKFSMPVAEKLMTTKAMCVSHVYQKDVLKTLGLKVKNLVKNLLPHLWLT